MSSKTKDVAPEFERARAQILDAKLRAELFAEEIAAPERIAKQAVAIAAGVKHSSNTPPDINSESGAGRFILLYDPEQAQDWGGDFRVVCYAQAPLEPEIGTDSFIAEVTWSWLLEALQTSGAEYENIAGTATNTISTGFGSLSNQGSGVQLELRASWSPVGQNFGAHAEAWSNLLCFLAGFPQAEGTISIDAYRNQIRKS